MSSVSLALSRLREASAPINHAPVDAVLPGVAARLCGGTERDRFLLSLTPLVLPTAQAVRLDFDVRAQLYAARGSRRSLSLAVSGT